MLPAKIKVIQAFKKLQHNVVQGFKQKIKQWTPTAVQSLISFFSPRQLRLHMNSYKESFNKRLERVLQLKRKITDKTSEAFNKAKKALVNTCQELCQPLFSQIAFILPQPMLRWIGLKMTPQEMQSKPLARFYAKTARVVNRFSERLKKVARKGRTAIVGWVKSIREKLQPVERIWKQKRQKISKVTQEVVLKTKMAYRRRVHWFRLMLAWIRVLRRHWMASIRTTVTQWGF